jgi:hypothetical protein
MMRVRQAALIGLLCVPPYTMAAAESFEAGFEAFKEGQYGIAIEQWQPLAEDGDARAQLGLARIYADPSRGDERFAEAVALYKRAASAGMTAAMIDLGELYFAGRRVPQDYAQARMWYALAGERESALGRDRLEALDALMTPGEIEQAKRLMREWRARRAEER